MDLLPRIISCIFWSLFLQIIQLPFAFSLQGGGNETDRLSLLAFKAQITSDPFGRLSSWNESLHFCQWSGVTCGSRHQRVIELDLQSSQLKGSLSPHIGNLSFLRTLNLGDNSLSHEIPGQLGGLFRLQALLLGNDTFSGGIPINISRCSNLLNLQLQGNNLSGKIPAELGELSKLQVLVFEKNNLVGEIPASFGNLSSVWGIYGIRNNLQGGIPSSIGQLRRLRIISLGSNNLSGVVPPSIYNLSSLVAFGVNDNQLSGDLPPDLGQTLPNLQLFRIHHNQFTGPIPVSISNVSNLTIFEFSYNRFTGQVPDMAGLRNLQRLTVQFNHLGSGKDDDLKFLYSLPNNTNLQILGINDNNLGGVLPEAVSNFSIKLKQMAMGRNQIRGSVPVEIGNLISLEALGVEENQLTGFIPTSIGKLQNLSALYMNRNRISGEIPSSLQNLSLLNELSLGQNDLQGNIPLSFGNFQKLMFLDLRQNNLSGPIPKEVIGLSSLSIELILSENQFTGSLPTEVGKLVNLGTLDVSKNKLSGEIPSTIGSCISLEDLDLGGNFFQGSIPSSLRFLKAIQTLDLSYNNLTGEIPKFLGDLKVLKALDLSFNGLEGEVPVKGVFENVSGVSVVGNTKICGGIPQLNLPRCTFNKSKSSTNSLLIVAIVCGCLGTIMVMCFLIYNCFLKTKKPTQTSNAPDSSPSMRGSLLRVTYEDLRQATDGFSSSNLVGAGSFGSVYKGILMDGTLVAVKVLNLLRTGASKSFLAECKVLTSIKHRNLVKVLTACSSIDFQHNDFKALVYEFMVNGNLDEWLHPTNAVDSTHSPRALNLIERLSIAIDVASALEYLHHDCEMPIVHCDLKPSNVLLNGNMTACVGDFGLARFLLETSHHVSSNETHSAGVEGTIGYTAPEYGMGSQVSTNGDIYSYGILLLEMFTGKRPTDTMFKDGLNLHNFVKRALPKSVLEVLDPVLVKEHEEMSAITSHKLDLYDEKHKIPEYYWITILEVGVACSMQLPRNRMGIRTAIAELCRVRDILLQTGMQEKSIPNCALDVVDPILVTEHEQMIAAAASCMRNRFEPDTHLERLIPILKVRVACSAELPRDRMDINAAAAELNRIRDSLPRGGMRVRRDM